MLGYNDGLLDYGWSQIQLANTEKLELVVGKYEKFANKILLTDTRRQP